MFFGFDPVFLKEDGSTFRFTGTNPVPFESADVTGGMAVLDGATIDLVADGIFTVHGQAVLGVIGDAAIQSPLPKSGYAANSEAKVCAANVVQLLTGKPLVSPNWINTCYSLITQEHGISVAMVYDLVDGKVAKVAGAGGVSKPDDMPGRALEASYAVDWYQNITFDIFG